MTVCNMKKGLSHRVLNDQTTDKAGLVQKNNLTAAPSDANETRRLQTFSEGLVMGCWSRAQMRGGEICLGKHERRGLVAPKPLPLPPADGPETIWLSPPAVFQLSAFSPAPLTISAPLTFWPFSPLLSFSPHRQCILIGDVVTKNRSRPLDASTRATVLVKN
jgi:hypothetical protein